MTQNNFVQSKSIPTDKSAGDSMQIKLFKAAAIISVCSCSFASAGDIDTNYSRDFASRLRAQPTESDPAWFVERGDNTSMNISALVQSRYTVSNRKTGFIAPGDANTYGFSNPRIQIALDGAIVSSQFNYRISFDLGDAELSRGRGTTGLLPGDTGNARLLDAYAQYNFTGKREGYYLKFGQFKHILMTEEAIDSQYQLAADRTLSSEIFGPGYTQGLALGQVNDNFAWEFSITDGGRYIGSRETDNTSFNSIDEADAGFGGRFDWKIQGSWDQFKDFTSFKGSTPGSKLGGGILYQFQGQTNPGSFIPGFVGTPAESGQIFTWTLDYQLEGDGWNFFAAYTGQYVDWEFATATLGIMNNSVVLQGGRFMSERTEVFARLETFWIDKLFRNGFSTPDGYIHRIGTVGMTYYLLPESHAAKFTTDVSYAFDSLFVLALGAGGSIALPDPGTTGFLGLTAHEIVFRAQLQFAF